MSESSSEISEKPEVILLVFSRFVNRFYLTIRTSGDVKDSVRSVISQENEWTERRALGSRLGAWPLFFAVLLLTQNRFVSVLFHALYFPPRCLLSTPCAGMFVSEIPEAVLGGKQTKKPHKSVIFFVNGTKFLSLCMQSANHGSLHPLCSGICE